MTQQPPATLGYATPQGTPFRSSELLSRTVVGLLFGNLVLEAGMTVFSAAEYVRLGSYATHDEYVDGIGAFDIAMALWGLLHLVTLIVAAVFWCIWQYRVHTNLVSFGRELGEAKPGWGIGCWFVPIINLFKPYKVMKHIFVYSEPGANEDLRRMYSDTSVVTWWWASWIIASILSNISLRVSVQSTDLTVLRSLQIVDVIAGLLSVVAAFLAIKIVREVQNRQTASLSQSPTASVGI